MTPVPAPWYFEDFAVGQVFRSQRRTVTESDVAAFAALTWDTNPVHTDAVGMQRSRFGERIAHGMLGISFAMGLVSRIGVFEHCSIALLGVRDWRFLLPVHLGDSLHAEVEITATRQSGSGDSGVLTRDFRVVNHSGSTVQQGGIDLLVQVRSHP